MLALSFFQSSELEDATDDTWIASAQSINQSQLIALLKPKSIIYLEGPYRIWLRRTSLAYFILRADSEYLPKYEDDTDLDGKEKFHLL